MFSYGSVQHTKLLPVNFSVHCKTFLSYSIISCNALVPLKCTVEKCA